MYHLRQHLETMREAREHLQDDLDWSRRLELADLMELAIVDFEDYMETKFEQRKDNFA